MHLNQLPTLSVNAFYPSLTLHKITKDYLNILKLKGSCGIMQKHKGIRSNLSKILSNWLPRKN